MNELKWPEWRLNVIVGLEGLAGTDADVTLTDSIHWVIDDTWWDQHSPSEQVGGVLRSEAEAAMISALIEPLLIVAEDVGPTAPDEVWRSHPSWPELMETANTAAKQLRANNA